MNQKPISLGWGESVVVRQAFAQTYSGPLFVVGPNQMENLGYSPFDGNPELIALTREVIKRQYGRSYKHVALTHGASGGVVCTLMAFKQSGYKTALTNPPPYFTQYPEMIRASGLTQVFKETNYAFSYPLVYLVDSPSNPRGIYAKEPDVFGSPVILDAVYNNDIYCDPAARHVIKHDVLIGSYSKLLGMNGTRIGWVALDDDGLFLRLKAILAAQYCSLSKLSVDFLIMALQDFDWERFEIRARGALNDNRGEWSLLERYFDGSVPTVGMFHYANVDAPAKKLLNKAGVEFTLGGVLGHCDQWGRFSLGQDTQLIREAVRRIRIIDGVK